MSVAAAWCAGAQGGAVTIDANKCAAIQAADERLACFESEVEEARRNPPPPAAANAPEAPPEDVIAAVASLREIVPNRFMITLDNGQVWRQIVPQPYALRQGSEVRIYYSRWNTFRLTNEQLRGFIQVERVR